MKYFIILVSISAALAMACSTDRPLNVVVTNTNTTTPAPAPSSPLPAATIDEFASGKRVYETSCQNCHKENGKGGPMEIEGKKIAPDDLTSDKIKKFTDEKIIGYIVNGIEDEGMPSFKGRLSEGEMRHVVKYIREEIQGMRTGLTGPKQ